MKNILYAMIAMLLLGVGFAAATNNCASVYADNPSAVTGTVYDQYQIPVEGADVEVKCGIADKVTVTSDSEGNYYACFDSSECDYGSGIIVEAEKADIGQGMINSRMCAADECFIPIQIVDVTIPEFGLMAGAVALVGALGIFLYKRK